MLILFNRPLGIMVRSLVRTFALFKYKKHSLVNVYCPMLEAPHESKIQEVIDIVEYEFTQHQKTMKGVVQNLVGQGKKDKAEWMNHCIKNLA